MDLIESIKTDKAYIKFKLIVKTWEKDFIAKYSRTPSKFDIKEAPSNIKYAYKKYFQLKSAVLENSLSVCEIDEENTLLSEHSPIKEDSTYISLSPQNDELHLSSLPSGQELEKLLTTSTRVKLSKQHTISPLTENLSKKLFKNRSYSLRNPRKATSQKSISLVESENEKEVVRNFNFDDTQYTTQISFGSEEYDTDANIAKKIVSESVVEQCNKFMNNNRELSILEQTMNPMIVSNVRNLDVSWLERASGLNMQENNLRTCKNYLDNNTIQFGITNVKVHNQRNKLVVDIVENSESEEDIAIVKLKPALKKRKIEKHHGHDNKSVCTYNKSTVIEGEDIIGNSVCTEDKTKKKNVKKNKVLKNFNVDQPPDITEYIPFGLENNIAPRHSKATDILKLADYSKNVNSDTLKTIDNYEKLENKVKHGTLNENFVRINIEKKVFVRGKKNITYSKYKKQQWKDKKALHAGMEFPEAGKISCFKCGTNGHIARYCKSQKGDSLLPLENIQDNDIPTLEDMQKLFTEDTNSTHSLEEQLSNYVYEPSPIPEDVLKMLSQSNSDKIFVKSIYSYNKQHEIPKEIYEALHRFGYESFRSGQEKAILRILCGMSTLLILPTGGGKSLCYQIPAFIYSQHYKCITLVISPLVSLMEDQVVNMPEFLKAGCLHTNQPPTQRKKIIECLKNGELNVLLISPEALISGDSSNGFSGLFKSLPQIAFACIDEAHCVSQWSHNFRPSYLMICRVLREKLNIKCILGLTATASQTTIKSIIDHINIPDKLNGVITNPALPENLCLSVSFEEDKDEALLSFLSSKQVSSFHSIIVYCIRRDECERVAALLRSCLQENGKLSMETGSKKRKRMSYIAEAYHAGMSGSQRKKIQKHFMDGILRIIVATVAFGMGINKSDIRCIIHYNMPSSFESYVQEVGRAGRDGKSAICHVLMSNSSNDKDELLKHIHSNSVDRPIVRKLLQKLFIPCDCFKSQTNLSKNICTGHEVGIPIDGTVEELDIPSENISTLLCYVELHPKKYIRVLSNAYTMCKISSYGGPQKISEAAKNCRPLAMAYLLEGKSNRNVTKRCVLEFNVIQIAAALGWESGMTKYYLKNLEWTNDTGVSKRSHLKVEFHTLGFRIRSRGDLSPVQLDDILDDLHSTVVSQEKAALYQLDESSKAFRKLGKSSLQNCDLSDDALLQKSNELKRIIQNYFDRDQIIHENIEFENRPLDTERVASDVRALISSYKDCTFTGRSIARIFQGISSPNFPAIIWGRCKFWRSHLHEDFYGIIKIANEQLILMKMY